MSTKSNARFLALSAVIAGLYAALTYAAAMLNLAYGPVQFRFSEALTVLPAFTPAAIPGRTAQPRSPESAGRACPCWPLCPR